MRRPKVSQVNSWELHELSNEVAKVYVADIDYGFFYKVEVIGFKPKYFYGESAWQDASRHANDALSAVLYSIS